MPLELKTHLLFHKLNKEILRGFDLEVLRTIQGTAGLGSTYPRPWQVRDPLGGPGQGHGDIRRPPCDDRGQPGGIAHLGGRKGLPVVRLETY